MCDTQYNEIEVIPMPEQDTIQNLLTELRRGSLTLAVLGSLLGAETRLCALADLAGAAHRYRGKHALSAASKARKPGTLNKRLGYEREQTEVLHRQLKGKEVLKQLLTEWGNMQRSPSRPSAEGEDNGTGK